MKNPNDMSILFNMDHELYSPCVDIVTTSVIDIIQNICEFLPKEGILGTNQNSALVSLIANGNRFPDYSFMDTERVGLFIVLFQRVILFSISNI